MAPRRLGVCRCSASCVREFTFVANALQRHEVLRDVVLKGFTDQQVVQRRGIENLENRGLDSRPDTAREAHRLARAAAWQIILGGAIHGCDLAFEHPIHLADGDRLRRTSQAVAAAYAARALDQACAPQLADELLEVGQRQALTSRDLSDRQQSIVAVRPSQLGHGAKSIVNAGGDLHTVWLLRVLVSLVSCTDVATVVVRVLVWLVLPTGVPNVAACSPWLSVRRQANINWRCRLASCLPRLIRTSFASAPRGASRRWPTAPPVNPTYLLGIMPCSTVSCQRRHSDARILPP